MSKAARTKQLGRIHILAKQIGMDREQYEAVLWTVARVESAKDLDAHGRMAVIKHLQSRLPKSGYKGRPNNADNPNRQELKKIEALLTDADLAWAYAQAMSQRMYNKPRLEFCNRKELSGIIAGLNRQAIKRLTQQLEYYCELWECSWEHMEHLAQLLFAFDVSHRELARYPEEMSKLYRWICGGLSVSCAYPATASVCPGCQQRVQNRRS